MDCKAVEEKKENDVKRYRVVILDLKTNEIHVEQDTAAVVAVIDNGDTLGITRLVGDRSLNTFLNLAEALLAEGQGMLKYVPNYLRKQVKRNAKRCH